MAGRAGQILTFSAPSAPLISDSAGSAGLIRGPPSYQEISFQEISERFPEIPEIPERRLRRLSENFRKIPAPYNGEPIVRVGDAGKTPQMPATPAMRLFACNSTRMTKQPSAASHSLDQFGSAELRGLSRLCRLNGAPAPSELGVARAYARATHTSRRDVCLRKPP